MPKKLLIAVIGHSNFGKSTTWYKLFGQTGLKTGTRSRELKLIKNGYTRVFLVNASPQERCKKIQDIIPEGLAPNIVLCSIQYPRINQDPATDNCGNRDNGYKNTYEYFTKNGYQIVTFWLRPVGNDDDHLKVKKWHSNNEWEFQELKSLNSEANAEAIKVYLKNWICDNSNLLNI